MGGLEFIIVVTVAAAVPVECCNNISGAKQLICQMSALYHNIVSPVIARRIHAPSPSPSPPGAAAGKRITHSGILGLASVKF